VREALFIFVVILLFAGLTAFRYRKQIRGMFEIARALKKVGGAMTGGNQIASQPEADTALVNCSNCGVWSPQSRARKMNGKFYCSDQCLSSRVR
jgi:hypothetical protein